ncbi:hypothetical protein AB5I41_11150 [Sphingomonas sp. MMS24-JH45]
MLDDAASPFKRRRIDHANGAGTLVNNATEFNALPAAIRAAFFLGDRTPPSPITSRMPTRSGRATSASTGGADQHRLLLITIAELPDRAVRGPALHRPQRARRDRVRRRDREPVPAHRRADARRRRDLGPARQIRHRPEHRRRPIGLALPLAPELSGNVALNLDQPVADDLNLTGRVQYRYTSAQLINAAGTSRQGAVSLLNANLGIKLPSSNLTVEVGPERLRQDVFHPGVRHAAPERGRERLSRPAAHLRHPSARHLLIRRRA